MARISPRRLARLVHRYGSWGLDEAWAHCSVLVGAIEPVGRPISARQGAARLGRRVVVFCHFDPHGEVVEHVRGYVEALRETGLSVVFVSNSGHLQPDAERWLLPRCAWVVIRRNVGYDFAAWRDGLEVAGLPAADTEFLAIANDSVYGPIRPLGPILARMDSSEADVWGMTDTWQRRYHLQSYFVAFTRNTLCSESFLAFWRGVRDLRSKTAVIRRYEIGLTQALLRAGLRVGVLWRYVDTVSQLRTSGAGEGDQPLNAVQRVADERHEAAAARRIALNPTAELWRPLTFSGFPFIKRELLRRNPADVPDVAAWLNLVRVVSPEDAEVILRDLARSLRNRAP